ncbi:MAG: T9SS type A sorting domain-containing protein [Balneola sp.]
MGYSKATSRWIKIQSGNDGFSIFDPLNPGDRQPLEIGKDIKTYVGEKPEKGKNKGMNVQSQPNQNYSVSVSGKIRFYQSSEDLYRGVYGNNVVLWFRDSSDPGTWYHPVYSSSGNQQNVHYDELDEQGNFSFNFNFNGDLTGYDELIVLVNTANDAAIIPVPQDGYITYYSSIPVMHFNESEGLTVPINPAQTTITINQNNNSFPSNLGRALRYMQISKEYTETLYNGSTPFSTPPILTEVNTSTSCGLFTNSGKWLFGWTWNQHITINPRCATFSTISHEFGHWLNYRMWTNDSKWNNSNDSLTEGWAIFFSFASRNYGNRKFGDDFEKDEDNPEEDAFETYPYRYAGISYADPDVPNTNKSAAAQSAFLWNLYDNVTDNNFLATTYNNADNDDIKDDPKRVFEKMRTLGTTSVANYRNHFKSGLSSDIQTSVDKIYSFMFDDLIALPATKMKSAQVKDLSANATTSQVSFNWNSSSYSSGDYKNQETGYRVSKYNGSSWQQLAQLSNSSNSYTISTPSTTTTYKVTSYNSEGESIFAPQVNVGPISNFSGPLIIETNEVATWNSTSTGGDTPYTYRWERRGSGSSSWTYLGSGSFMTLSYSTPQYFDLRLKVTDSDNIYSYFQRQIIVNQQSGGGGCADPTIPCKRIGESLPTEFSFSDNYPNPFNPSTQIRFELPERAEVSIKVYNIMGQEVATLINSQMQAGFHNTTFNADNLASGVYIARLSAIGSSGERFIREIKMQLIK